MAAGLIWHSDSGYDIFLGKFSPQGAPILTRSYGGPNYQAANHIHVGPDGVLLVTGIFDGQTDFGGQTRTAAGQTDLFVAAYSPDANLESVLTIGGPAGEFRGQAIIDRPSGDWMVTGQTSGNFDFGGQTFPTDFLFRASPQGNIRWVRFAGGLPIAETSDPATVVVGGAFPGQQISSHERARGETKWSFGLGTSGEVNAVASGQAGVFLLAGAFESTLTLGGVRLASRGERDAFVMALDSTTGRASWSEVAVAGAGLDRATSICVAPGGFVYVGGSRGKEPDDPAGAKDRAFIAKYDASGTRLWLKLLEIENAEAVPSLLCDGDDGPVAGLNVGLAKLAP